MLPFVRLLTQVNLTLTALYCSKISLPINQNNKIIIKESRKDWSD